MSFPRPAPLGTLLPTDDGRYALRFERRFAHPPAKVWRAITEPEHLRAWGFPAVVTFDLTPGAKLRFDMTPEARERFDLPEGAATTSDGEITRVEPPYVLEYTWGAELLRWELSDDGAGGCRLVFTDVIEHGGGTPEGTVSEMAGAWHAAFEVLDAHLDDQQVGWSVWDRADELRDAYARGLG